MSVPSRRQLDRELAELQVDIVKLGELVMAAIAGAGRCLDANDATLAGQIAFDDRRVNALRYHVEEECIALIATQQPAATDLRRVLSAINIVGDLERMGDHAAGIARTVVRIHDLPQQIPGVNRPPLLHMADICRVMLADSLEAFRNGDVALARQVAVRDDEVDELNRVSVETMLALMVSQSHLATAATYHMWCAHNFERIGDRATNISERVIFMTTGTMQELNV